KINQEEYNILFCTKEDWKKDSTQIELFNKALQKVIKIQEPDNIDLSFVKFPLFIFNTFNFFTHVSQTISFKYATFYDDADFSGVTFHNNIYFFGAKFYADTNFIGTVSKELIDFSEISFKKLNLWNARFNEVNFSGLSGIKNNKQVTINKVHFRNKESARLIKSHFEKQNNITDANKYFQIEQEIYIDYLRLRKPNEPQKNLSLITLYLNKWVSNFGTDWVRSILLLFMLSYLFMRFYIDFDKHLSIDEPIKHFTRVSDIQYIWTMFVSWGLLYLSTFFKSDKFIFSSLIFLGIIIGLIGLNTYDNVLAIQNYIIQLTNPINAFKNMNLFEGIELYGAIVRIIVVTIIYQFIVAFRQNTRRK
ncbi:MAG: pentapeptide repeat-containing protein, partial [Flavobacteriaceae bacterium]|nr:pentapeptide repeat-containing protein [Flavobacteriaceae bacterium]